MPLSRVPGLPARLPVLLPALVLAVAAAVVAALLVAPGGSAARATGSATPSAAGADTGTTASATASGERRAPASTRVLAISVDGLLPRAIEELGKARTPHLHRLLGEGASTTNARTARELTVTLPNHTSMVTGRRIARGQGGHGVTWNVDRRGTTVQRAARGPVDSVFAKVQRAGRSAALFTGKSKFSLFRRSWPAGVDRYVLEERMGRLVTAARRDLVRRDRAFTFLHLAAPDVAGHESDFMSPAYLGAVERVDAQLGRLLAAIDRRGMVEEGLTVILTSDHGGLAGTFTHDQRTELANYRIPFLVWGAGVTAGDLYDLNPERADPGDDRPRYRGPQPVRNGDLANVATRLLGIGKVRRSEFGVGSRLLVSAPAAAPGA